MALCRNKASGVKGALPVRYNQIESKASEYITGPHGVYGNPGLDGNGAARKPLP